jgi:hypothetical protein
MVRKFVVIVAALLLGLPVAGAIPSASAAPQYPPDDVGDDQIVTPVGDPRVPDGVGDDQIVTPVGDPKGPQGDAAKSRDGALARTGGDALPWVQLGVGLIVVGFLGVLLERNRRAAQAREKRLGLT